MLDISHLSDYFLVSCHDDYSSLKEVIEKNGLERPNIVIFDFNLPLYDIGKELFRDTSIPNVVANFYMDYGEKSLMVINCF